MLKTCTVHVPIPWWQLWRKLSSVTRQLKTLPPVMSDRTERLFPCREPSKPLLLEMDENNMCHLYIMYCLCCLLHTNEFSCNWNRKFYSMTCLLTSRSAAISIAVLSSVRYHSPSPPTGTRRSQPLVVPWHHHVHRLSWNSGFTMC